MLPSLRRCWHRPTHCGIGRCKRVLIAMQNCRFAKCWFGSDGAFIHMPAPGPPELRKTAAAFVSIATASETRFTAAACEAFARRCCEAATPSSPTSTLSSQIASRKALEAIGSASAVQGLIAISALTLGNSARCKILGKHACQDAEYAAGLVRATL